jgi:signal transduction histidine kinase
MADQHKALSRGIFIGMAFVVAMALAQLGVVEYSYHQSAASRDRSLAYADARFALENALRNFAEAQNTQLEYLVTRRADPLDRYRQARDRVLPAFDKAIALSQGDSAGADLAAARGSVAARLAELDRTLELFGTGREQDAQARIVDAATANADAKTATDLAALTALYQARMADTTTQWREVRELSRALLVLLTVSVILMFLWVFRSAEAQAGRIASRAQRVEDDKEKLESLVRARTDELTELTTYLHKVREDERRSLARELHDELGSILTAAKLDITFIRSRCAQSNPELVPKCDRISAMLDQGTALKRRIIDNLRPSTLDMLGLAPAARDLVETFAGTARITVDAEIDDDIVLRNDDALVLFRVIQEALRNVEQHSHATAVAVELRREGDMMHVLVRDNGGGFDPLAPRGAGGGIALMRQRLRALGGKFTVNAAPGNGTVIEAWLPARGE